jgi:intein-encoded DNA endonuclease-like protein
MKTKEEFQEVKKLLSEGLTPTEISRLTGINRSTINDWRDRPPKLLATDEPCYRNCGVNIKNSIISDPKLHPIYSYLLGLYLGDGCISQHPRTFRLRLALDKKYPNLNNYAKKQLETLFVNNKIGVVDCGGNIALSVYGKQLPEVFPQHDTGKKHHREIVLEQWQKDVLIHKDFLKGFFHSDGSYYLSNGNGFYNFTNHSNDIINLYLNTIGVLGFDHAIVRYKTGKIVINHNKRKTVSDMLKVIGTKKDIIE